MVGNTSVLTWRRIKTWDGSRVLDQAVKEAMSRKQMVHSGNRSAMGWAAAALASFSSPLRKFWRRDFPDSFTCCSCIIRSRTSLGNNDETIAVDLMASFMTRFWRRSTHQFKVKKRAPVNTNYKIEDFDDKSEIMSMQTPSPKHPRALARPNLPPTRWQRW